MKVSRAVSGKRVGESARTCARLSEVSAAGFTLGASDVVVSVFACAGTQRLILM